MPSDQDLIERCLAGDRGAFDGIVQHYQDGLFRHLLRLASSPEQAEDLCQEAFVKFYAALARFDRRRGVAPFLFKIATNLWRDRQRAPLATVEIGAVEGTAADCRVDEEVLRRLERQAILNAIGRLRRQYREVLSLRYDQGLSYREIAEVTGLTPGTVATWLHRAVNALRAALQEKCAEEVPR